jgi:2-oxoglutarate dehydrogenase E2 component (dihydrolipoamide succinyltransferase)
MSSNVEVPTLGESITEAVLLQWLKNEGDQVAVDEPICELESDKATVDLPAPVSGILHPKKQAGETAHVGEVIAEIDEVAAKDGLPAPAKSKERPAERTESSATAKPPSAEAPHRQESPAPQPEVTAKEKWKVAPAELAAAPPKPAKEQQARIERPPEGPPKDQPSGQEQPSKTEASKARTAEREATQPAPCVPLPSPPPADAEGTRRVAMSKIRRSIAERLVRAQQATAMLTTFNEIDMTTVEDVRARHQERFKQAHGVGLGLMSFFARASVLALKQFPILNARLDGDDIVYHDHANLGIAVSTNRGLVVPVLHNVETLSLAHIEKEIKRLAAAARDGKLSIHDLSGGTFTITNGGVFGSLLSTPILNPPQTGILGMHVIQDRPVAVNRQVEIRPMMYVALTYDHRLVDGQDAVSFLVRMKQLLEDPVQIILEI